MWYYKWCAVAALASAFLSQSAAYAEGAPTGEPGPSRSPTKSSCNSVGDFLDTDCPLTWHGITVFGTYDIGGTWVSHGLPENGYNYEGESLVNKNGKKSRFLVAQNNLSQTGVGIKGREEFLPG